MSLWDHEGFLEHYDQWVAIDEPPVEWQVAVLDWIRGLETSPYIGATRVRKLGADVWWTSIREAQDDERGTVAVYLIDEERHVATCASITCLGHPITP